MGTVGKLRLLGQGWGIIRGKGGEGSPWRSAGGLHLETGEPAQETGSSDHAAGSWLFTLGWISAGAGALGLGLLIGRELRQRYKFQRRTPYDLYSHAGDRDDLEFGVGI